MSCYYNDDQDYDYNDRYEGSYAHDEEGYSDDDIDDDTIIDDPTTLFSSVTANVTIDVTYMGDQDTQFVDKTPQSSEKE